MIFGSGVCGWVSVKINGRIKLTYAKVKVGVEAETELADMAEGCLGVY